MSVFSRDFVAEFDQQHTLLGVTSLCQLDLLVRTQNSHLCVLRIKHPSVTLALEAVCDNGHVAKVADVDVNCTDQHGRLFAAVDVET